MQSSTQRKSISSLSILRRGSTGEDVRNLQVLLNQTVVANLSVDGIFGSKTEDAVKTTQSIFFLEIDGIVGAKTWTVLRTKEPIEMPVLLKPHGEDYEA